MGAFPNRYNDGLALISAECSVYAIIQPVILLPKNQHIKFNYLLNLNYSS
ncbi:hypothetical protein THOB06_30170 [Vibrio rotiferianus]|nr:hypothetical protein THOG10_30170 [Vibrio rotiferianus]CAH1582942.1 hypothetical protein THOB06_30170 [Vibrio rotiferianus]